MDKKKGKLLRERQAWLVARKKLHVYGEIIKMATRLVESSQDATSVSNEELSDYSCHM
jgi:hypothetical protein